MSALLSIPFFGSELILVVSFFIAMALDFAFSDKKWVAYFTLAALALAWWFGPPAGASVRLFFGSFVWDPVTHFFKGLIYGTIGLTVIASLAYEQIPGRIRGEFYMLLVALALLLTVMGASVNLLMIFLAIESVSLTSYLLVGFQKFDQRASEAALKYVLFGAVSTALMLFGMSLLFGITGSIELSIIGAHIAKLDAASQTLALIGMLFVLAGIGFKISVVPFHFWAPDVYQGAPTPITAFLTIAPKALGFAVLARVFLTAFPFFMAQWATLFSFLAILTMTIGNVLAVSQHDIKRLLAYSSIAQAGYILVGLAAPSSLGLQAILVYVIAYLFTNLGAFFAVLAIERQLRTNDIGAYNGLAKRNPFLALSLTIFLLSLAGIPPLAGFIGKIFIFASAVKEHAFALAIAIALNSAVAAYYYFKVVKAMYLTPADSAERIENPMPTRIAICITLAGTLAIGIWPTVLIRFAEQALIAFPTF